MTKLKPRAARYAEPDPELAGHYVRVTPNGGKTFVAVAREPGGRQIWATVGACDLLGVDEARERAREAIKRIKAGLPAFEAPAPKLATFGDVTDAWLARHVEAKGLRSEPEIRRLLKVHISPEWSTKEIDTIRRSDVVALLDKVEDEHGARQADYVLNITRAIFNWHATRADGFAPPIVRGMRRQDPKAHARARILEDAEIKAIWQAAGSAGAFGGVLRLALLTAQRRTKVVGIRWIDLSDDGEWTIAREPREKDSAGSLVLPALALDVIKAQARLASNPYVFPGRGGSHFAGFSQGKARLDEKLADVRPWVIHDLRRTARSLLSRAGVSSDIAERVMGHVIPGVEGVYDRHSYREEKAEALRKLAALVGGIINA